ncbi:MAG: Hsp20/alpha crystallin family protein [Gammaproteobacteria bacterium]|nr:Hsp20/alpha crystallin family protein [Gammaproteobacteria bacterium]
MSEATTNQTVVPEKVAGLQRRRARSMSPFDEMDRLFEGLFPRGWAQPIRREWPEWIGFGTSFEGRVPKVDVLERDETVVVRAELPGVDKDSLDISLTEDSVTISATIKQEGDEEEGDYHCREILQGSFSRTVALPVTVQSDQAKARFYDGVLVLTLPKAAPAKRHTIKIETD